MARTTLRTSNDAFGHQSEPFEDRTKGAEPIGVLAPKQVEKFATRNSSNLSQSDRPHKQTRNAFAKTHMENKGHGLIEQPLNNESHWAVKFDAFLSAETKPLTATVEQERIFLPTVSRPSDVEPIQDAARHSLSADTKVSGSVWTLVRRGATAASLAENGQIGGAQMGFRVNYSVLKFASFGELSASSRVSFPLAHSNQLEATVGVKFAKRGKVPIELIAERRFPFGHHTNGAWSLTAASGVNDLQLGRKLKIDGYFQAGIVGVKSRKLFAGGSAVISTPASSNSDRSIRLGAGVWGDAQPNAARLDVGPDVSFRTKILGMPTRVSGQWRFRILGKAQPNSGPAIVIGGDF